MDSSFSQKEKNLVSERVPSHFKRSLLPLMRTPRLPVVEWFDAPADLNGLVRFAERQNLLSARVPSHFKRSLLPLMRTPRLQVADWTDAPAYLNGLVRFAERRNMISARVSSHLKHSLTTLIARSNWSRKVLTCKLPPTRQRFSNVLFPWALSAKALHASDTKVI